MAGDFSVQMRQNPHKEHIDDLIPKETKLTYYDMILVLLCTETLSNDVILDF